MKNRFMTLVAPVTLGIQESRCVNVLGHAKRAQSCLNSRRISCKAGNRPGHRYSLGQMRCSVFDGGGPALLTRSCSRTLQEPIRPGGCTVDTKVTGASLHKATPGLARLVVFESFGRFSNNVDTGG